MRTPYIPHLFGEEALAKTRDLRGWLNAAVASSIAWPQDDVWVEYDGVGYLLHGARQEGDHYISPCISTHCGRTNPDHALLGLFRFTSVLGFFKRGYVDITLRGSGSHLSRMVDRRQPQTMLQGGNRTFRCNHMPIVEDDQVRRALAFLREGRRLQHVHEPYSFLSFFKVIESQFDTDARIAWVDANLGLLTEQRAVARIAELRGQGIEVNRHLFDSGDAQSHTQAWEGRS